jgi:FtsP/CotA-like multicopper oxidase with cupredoxin domain
MRNRLSIMSIPLFFAAFLLALSFGAGEAAIDGITGTAFNFTAKQGYISLPDGSSLLGWGYANGAGPAQFPGPTLILNEGQTVTITLTNQLAVPVSIVFPGQANVSASGGSQGLIAREAAPAGGTVTYQFTASNPGTYTYYSGTRPDLQVMMGLSGAIVVRPAIGQSYAYNSGRTRFNREYLFFLSEIDPALHQQVALGQPIDTTLFAPTTWLINGRAAPDTLSAAFSPLFPHQPYNISPRMHPGETVLIRMVGAGRDMHPFHTHGNNHTVIARDGRLLTSTPNLANAAPDLGESAFTSNVAPGQTLDALFTWTGEGLGWDFYGHSPADPLAPGECVYNGVQNPTDPRCDHGKPLPVDLPNQENLTFGPFYAGSPFMGLAGALPPGEGGFNPNSGFVFMWHSHSEKELTNNNLFPGGMLTMMIVEHPNVIIDPSNP